MFRTNKPNTTSERELRSYETNMNTYSDVFGPIKPPEYIMCMMEEKNNNNDYTVKPVSRIKITKKITLLTHSVVAVAERTKVLTKKLDKTQAIITLQTFKGKKHPLR